MLLLMTRYSLEFQRAIAMPATMEERWHLICSERRYKHIGASYLPGEDKPEKKRDVRARQRLLSGRKCECGGGGGGEGSYYSSSDADEDEGGEEEKQEVGSKSPKSKKGRAKSSLVSRLHAMKKDGQGSPGAKQ